MSSETTQKRRRLELLVLRISGQTLTTDSKSILHSHDVWNAFLLAVHQR